MNTLNQTTRQIVKGFFLLSLFIFSSCGTIYFDNPQPVDSKNLKSVPKEIQGTWKTVNRFPDATTIGEDGIKIDKVSFTKYYTTYYTIAKPDIDNSLIYNLSGGKLIVTRHGVRRSYLYKEMNDSIYYYDQEIEMKYVLSDSVLLRKANGCYVANLKYKNWWQVVFIQKLKEGDIFIIYPVEEDLMKMKPEYNLAVLDSAKRDSIYFHASFKSKSIKNVINKEATIYTLYKDSTFETTK